MIPKCDYIQERAVPILVDTIIDNKFEFSGIVDEFSKFEQECQKYGFDEQETGEIAIKAIEGGIEKLKASMVQDLDIRGEDIKDLMVNIAYIDEIASATAVQYGKKIQGVAGEDKIIYVENFLSILRANLAALNSQKSPSEEGYETLVTNALELREYATWAPERANELLKSVCESYRAYLVNWLEPRYEDEEEWAREDIKEIRKLEKLGELEPIDLREYEN